MFFDTFNDLCIKKGVSCKRAAEDIGLSNSITTKWKKTGATPTGETLSRIAAYFNVSVGFLLGNDEDIRALEKAKSALTDYSISHPDTGSGKRLDVLFTASGYDHVIVCFNLGIDQYYLDNWMSNNDLPPKPIVDKILGVFRLKPEDLLSSSELADYYSEAQEWGVKGKAPTATGERSGSHDVLDDVDIAFYGDYKELTEDDKATVRDMVRIMRERRSKKQGQ